MIFSYLHEAYAEFFEEVKNKRPKSDLVFFMSIDAEWYEDGSKNFVLSYQIATASETKTKNIIEYTVAGTRLTLAEVVELGLRSVISDEDFHYLRRKKITVILISHNVTAEWSVLADRDEPHITKRISQIRGQPTTETHPIKIEINDVIAINILIFDTMLLAPASYGSLKNLSTLLGNSEHDKIEIEQEEIENMHLFLRDNPEKYEQYALRDSELGLRLFFVLQKSLNELVNNLFKKSTQKTFKLYRTLASAGVASFAANNEKFDEYRKKLKSFHGSGYSLIERSYYGGRSEAFFVGRTNRYTETKNKIWLDIDFSGCYPTTMALCPEIDFEGAIKYIPRSYSLDDDKVLILENNKVPNEIIHEMREALSKSDKDFDKAMLLIKNKKVSWMIREIASHYDNSIIDDWYERWKAAKQNKDETIERFLIPGFARIQFKFSPETQFPCLPIKHDIYGLLYVLEGETVVTAAEIMLAMDAGAEIKALTSIEYPIKKVENQPVQFLLNHLSVLAKKRNDYKMGTDSASKIMEKLVKEFTNSLYGKFSQAINSKEMFSPATGESIRLKPSTISEPCIATLTTSTARAALSAVLLAVESFNKEKPSVKQITVISGTTDGLLIGIPAQENYTAIDDFYDQEPLRLKYGVENKFEQILDKFGCSALLDKLNEYLPIRQMRNAREQMTSKSQFLEIKHIADEIISIKTRGQIGRLSNGKTVLLARFNLKPPISEIIKDKKEYKKIMEGNAIERNTVEADWIIQQLDIIESGNNEIQKYPFITLNKFSGIYKSDGQFDLTQKVTERIINFSYDWKRKLTWIDDNTNLDAAVSPFSQPHATTTEMLQHRDKVVKFMKEGQIPSPSAVLRRLEISKIPLNRSGGDSASLARLFLRALTQDKIDVQQKKTYPVGAEIMNTIWDSNILAQTSDKKWKIDDFKKAKNVEWLPLQITPDRVTVNLIKELALAFTADPDKTVDILFGTLEVKESRTHLLGYILTAMTQAAKEGIYPFAELGLNGFLPDKKKVIKFFSEYLTEGQVTKYSQQAFIPGGKKSSDRQEIITIFRQLGLPAKSSEACADCLVTKTVRSIRSQHNPGKVRCLKQYIRVINQSDIANTLINQSDIVPKLAKFGLTSQILREESNKRFDPNGIRNTPENKKQIEDMSKALNLDHVPLIRILIEQS